MAHIINEVSRTFNEFLLLPGRTRKDCSVQSVEVSTPLARHRLGEPSPLILGTPVTSAIMQSVSSHDLAIALARAGGLSFLYHNQPIEDQAAAVRRVKTFKSGFVTSDTNVRPTDALRDLVELMERTGHSTAAVTEDGTATGTLLGMVSKRDFHPQRHDLDAPVSSRMRPIDSVPSAKGDITLTEANDRLFDEHLDVLPVLDHEGHLHRLIFRSDYEDNKRFPHQLVDASKRLRVGAGVNTHDYKDRIPALVDADVDVLCFDSSDGYSDYQADALAWAKQHYPHTPIGGGNVVDAEGFDFLAQAGADFVKVGVGGGSICITRDQKGIGRGQASAVLDTVAARDRYAQQTGIYVPICSDGGLVHDYHITLALAMGADFVMMGRYFARFDQAPGAKIPTKEGFVKEYWGEGSARARNWQRYGQATKMLFEEGVDGYVPYAGDLHEGLASTLAKIKATMVSCGASNIPAFQTGARLTLVSEQSFQESHANVTIRETTGTTH
ncbi:IMP dehydrogenase [Natronoglycomyces albus]|uniref:IMP dehydrogenase n=1 Tax=Natronoglycomyces albus TaxID=2811108 RepID=A0A895XRT2_9ACTN|nr:IMP dehydrogenase [Natronoglycomyces albus]QSB06049.1 IMP dehydrogenase [Natronoglycomyces albus]